MNAREIIATLGLEPLPREGGYFKQTYLSPESIPCSALPERYAKDMPYGTAIYALITATDFSAMHVLDTDEIYHFYAGDALEMLLLYPDETGTVAVLGTDLAAGMHPQILVPRYVWQGSRPISAGSHGYTLIGTTMAPAFDWEHFVLGDRMELIEKYPKFEQWIDVRIR